MNATNSIGTLKARWPLGALNLRRTDAVHARPGVLLALFTMGFATFVNLYATQPLLPRFRQLFHASELMVSLTVSAPVLAVAASASAKARKSTTSARR